MGRNALMLACICNKLELVERLLAEGEQELQTQDNDGNTALILAAQSEWTISYYRSTIVQQHSTGLIGSH